MRHIYTQGEIAALCREATAKADARLRTLPAGFAACEQFERVTAELFDATEPAVFMMNVHTDAAIRDEAKNAREYMEKYYLGLYGREDIFAALEQASSHAQGDVQKRLVEKMLLDFRRNGMGRPKQVIDAVLKRNERLAELKAQFSMNLYENRDFITITEEETRGLPPSFIERLERADGGYRVKADAADVVPFMTHCASADARKRMLEVYESKEAQRNTPLLAEALRLRREIAQLLGYRHWGDYSTEVKMSKSAAAVRNFLDDIRAAIGELHRRDLALLQSYKRRDSPDGLRPWDIAYYNNKAREELHDIDDELLREYFPADHVVREMFALYSSVFGIVLNEIMDADVWAPGVRLFEIRDGDGTLLAHFYADFFPRDGKYNHFAAFNIRDTRAIGNERVTPVAAMVCNFTPATQSRPSLLTHAEVETLFHEFGHIMHTTLSQVPYASLAGFKIAWDFVEAPSQMLENWVWQPEVLQKVSRHYRTGEPLPAEMIARLTRSRQFTEGYFWMRQVLFSTYDLRIHTEELDPIETYRRMYREIMGIEPIPTTHWPAGWGHIMGGYEAGYYTYTWSRVFAQDMFTRFEEEGILSPAAGAQYRKRILEPGDLRDAGVLVREFLGREPSNAAFLRLVGAKGTATLL